MGFIDKFRNSLTKGKGRARRNAGRAAGNRRLMRKGRAKHIEASVRQAGEHVKDAGKNLRGAFKR